MSTVSAKLDALADKIRALPNDRRDLLLSDLERPKIPETFSLRDVAESFECSTRTLLREISRGRLRAFKAGHAYRVTRGDLDDWIEARRVR